MHLWNRLSLLSLSLSLSLSLASLVVAAGAQAASIGAGSLTLDLDGNAFASLGGGLPVPGYELLVLDEHFDQAESAIRDRAAILADEVDALPSTSGLVYGINGASVSNLALRNSQPTSFTFDPSDVVGTAIGSIGFGGVDRWQVNPLVGGGVLVIGDFSLAYDSSRAVGAASGWILYNHFDFLFPAFDLGNVALTAGPDSLSLSGDVLVTPEFATVFLNSPGDSGRDVGNFSLLATPEPSTAIFVGLGLSALASTRRRALR
ncbi:MAG: PEP-CTERM sorting domain-containing protein [Myxococcota bacterium]